MHNLSQRDFPQMGDIAAYGEQRFKELPWLPIATHLESDCESYGWPTALLLPLKNHVIYSSEQLWGELVGA